MESEGDIEDEGQAGGRLKRAGAVADEGLAELQDNEEGTAALEDVEEGGSQPVAKKARRAAIDSDDEEAAGVGAGGLDDEEAGHQKPLSEAAGPEADEIRNP